MFMHMFLKGATWKTALARRLAPILDGVRHFVAESAHSPAPPALAWKTRAQIAEILSVTWNRIGLLLRRLDNLHAKFVAGTLRPPRIRRKPQREPRPAAATPYLRLPTARLWLWRLALPAGSHIVHLRNALAEDAEFHALLAAAPQQAGRLLRPLYRMLGLDIPEALARPKPPRKPRPRKPAPAQARPQIDPDVHYRFSQVPRKWRLKVPILKKSRR